MQTVLFFVSPFVALLASLLVIAVIRFLDVIEREPWWAIAVSFVIGLMTVIPAIVLSLLGNEFWSLLLGPEAPLEMLATVVTAPVVEEAVKAAGVLLLLLVIRREMGSLTDFVVYACVVAVAFEFCENTLYLWSRLSTPEGAALAWLAEFNARTVASAGMHALYSAWIGFGMWCLVRGRGPIRWIASVGGFTLAILLHALNNLAALLSNVGDPAIITVVNHFGSTIGAIGNIVEMALFMALIGSAVFEDLHVLAEFGLVLQQRLQIFDEQKRLSAMQRLYAFINPFHHLLAHNRITWDMSPLARRSPVGRAEYARFARAALHHRSGTPEEQNDLDVGLGLLLSGSNGVVSA